MYKVGFLNIIRMGWPKISVAFDNGEEVAAVEPTVESGASQEEVQPVLGQAESQAPAATETSGQEGEAEQVREAPKAKSPLLSRIDALTRQREEARREAEEAKAALEALRGTANPSAGVPTEDLIPRSEAEKLAQQIAAQNEFNRRCNDVHNAALKEIPEYKGNLEQLQAAFGSEITPEFLSAVLETDAPGHVLSRLGGNLELAAEIFSKSPMQRAVALAKLGEKTAAAPKPVSKAPAPISPKVGVGGVIANPTLSDDIPMAEWVKLREKQLSGRK